MFVVILYDVGKENKLVLGKRLQENTVVRGQIEEGS
jgi:hypothetical protein